MRASAMCACRCIQSFSSMNLNLTNASKALVGTFYREQRMMIKRDSKLRTSRFSSLIKIIFHSKHYSCMKLQHCKQFMLQSLQVVNTLCLGGKCMRMLFAVINCITLFISLLQFIEPLGCTFVPNTWCYFVGQQVYCHRHRL